MFDCFRRKPYERTRKNTSEVHVPLTKHVQVFIDASDKGFTNAQVIMPTAMYFLKGARHIRILGSKKKAVFVSTQEWGKLGRNK